MSLEDKIGKLEKALNEINNRLTKIEEKVGITQQKAEVKIPQKLSAPLPSSPTPPTPKITPKSSTPSAPIPKPVLSTPSAPIPKPSSTSSSIGLEPSVKKKQIIKQALPRGGATSQIKAKKGIYNCPQCDSDYYEELEDKSKPLYTMGPGIAIYKKKLRCWNCGHEWPKPA